MIEKEEGEVVQEEKRKESFDKTFTDHQKRVSISNWQCRGADLYEDRVQVGEGTFGKVYKAKYKYYLNPEDPLGKYENVALKQIRMDNEKEGFPITAVREIMILKQLYHQNIINLLEIITSKPTEKNKFRGNTYLVFEYMEHDLNGLMDRKVSFDIPQIKCIMHQILSGILYLHNNNIMHRDIKGANILLNNKGEVKIADFGLARFFNRNSSFKVNYTNRVVTLWYRSPELLLGEQRYDSSIDMWSVGCLFSELLCDVPAFKGTKENDQVEKIFEKCGSPTEETWPGVTSLKYYSQYAPPRVYPRKLKSFYLDNKKVDDVAFDLLEKMLELNPAKRISASNALKHEYFSKNHSPVMCKKEDLPKIEKDSHEYLSRQNKIKQQQQQQQNQQLPLQPLKEQVVAKQPYVNPNYWSKSDMSFAANTRFDLSNENGNNASSNGGNKRGGYDEREKVALDRDRDRNGLDKERERERDKANESSNTLLKHKRNNYDSNSSSYNNNTKKQKTENNK